MKPDLVDLERATAALDGVRDAAVAIRRVRRAAPVAPPAVEAATKPAPAARRAAEPGLSQMVSPPPVPAVVHGPPLVAHRGDPLTLADGLFAAARNAPTRGTTYVLPDGTQDRQTYPELITEALAVLGGLQRAGVRQGESVVLHLRDNRSFVSTFWACILGGLLPTPIGQAPGYKKDNATIRKMHAAWRLLDRPLIVTDVALRADVAGLAALWGEQAFWVTTEPELAAGTAGVPAELKPDDPALHLLTSGSTGTPKCVRHTHRSVVARTLATIAANDFTAQDVSLNWMPLDHVGGIVMYNVRDVLLGCEHINATVAAFIQRPLSWLDWMHAHRPTNTWAPNFAFALVAEQAAEIAQGSWDLSSLRHICNAGEAVVARTAHRFLELLEPHQLPAEAMVPCWGMSETSSGVTYSRMRRHEPTVGTVCLDSSSLDGELAEVPLGTPGSIVLTEVGPPIAGVSLRIVDAEDRVIGTGRIGRLQVSGAALLEEYYRNPEAQRASRTADGWFDTGDLGFLRHGRLTLTGRRKDMVIVNGANHPAHDLEAVVELVPGVRVTHSAVCGVHDPATGTDAVVVFFVPTAGGARRIADVVGEIRAALGRETGLTPRDVVPVPAADFPKTANGKIQRGQLVEAFQAGRLMPVSRSDERAAAPWLLERVVTVAPATATGVPLQPGTALLVYARERDELPQELARRGMAVWALRAGEGDDSAVIPAGVWVDPTDPVAHRTALARLARSRDGIPTRVIYAWSAGVAAAAGDPADPTVELVTALGALAELAPGCELTVLTRAAIGTDPAEPVEPTLTALTAAVRTAAAERALTGVRLLDLPAGADDATAAAALVERPVSGPDPVADRVGGRLVERLRVVEDLPDALAVPRTVLRTGGAVLVTGGLGGIGVGIVRHLVVAEGARVLVVGRTREQDLDRTRRDALEELGLLGDVRYAAADVADAGELGRVVAAAEADWGQTLELAVHLAGADVRDQWDDLGAHTLAAEDPAWVRHMLAPKLGGAAAIDMLLADRPGAAVVLFSSVSGLLGGVSYGAYAAANAGLDGWAQRWSAQGRTVRCLAWSMWTGLGMNAGSPLIAAAEHRGLRAIRPGHGIALLLAGLNQHRSYLLVGADADNSHVQPLLADDQLDGAQTVLAVVPDGTREQDALCQAVADRARALGAAEPLVLVVPGIPRDAGGAVEPGPLLRAVEDAVRAAGKPGYLAPEGPIETLVAEILGDVIGTRIGRDDGFFGVGGDSIRAIQAVGRLNQRLGLDLPVSALYEHPTPRELAPLVDPVGATHPAPTG